ncbi:MAG: hypothetical protein RL431_536 [Actinomycetota bacterium]|jgi:DNA-binding transcriptional ArsR family regulator
MEDIFDVLAEQIRRDILVTLRNAAPADMSVGDIVGAVGSTQPTASKHLKVLREAGLVAVREEGQHRYYRLNPEPLATVEGWISGMNTAPAPAEAVSVDKPEAPASTASYLPEADYSGIGRQVGRFLADVTHEALGITKLARTVVLDATSAVTEKTGEFAERFTQRR